MTSVVKEDQSPQSVVDPIVTYFLSKLIEELFESLKRNVFLLDDICYLSAQSHDTIPNSSGVFYGLWNVLKSFEAFYLTKHVVVMILDNDPFASLRYEAISVSLRCSSHL